MTAAENYAAWLAARGGADPTPGPKLGDSPYELFFVNVAPGVKLHAAAASPDAVVTPGDPAGWGAYLRSATPAVLQGQIGWMQGAWMGHAPSNPASAEVLARDPKAKQYVTDPKVVATSDGGLVFEAFYGEPPRMDPFRFRVTVSAAGAATFAVEPVWQLP